MQIPDVLVPISLFTMLGVLFIVRSEIGCAIADRIRGQSRLGAGVAEELAQLRGELEGLRQELVETQERLEFAERLLAQPDRAGRLGPAPEPR